MKHQHTRAIIAIFLMIAATESRAVYMTLQEDKLFTTDGVIQEGDYYETVAVYDTPPAHTTVNMTGGRVGDDSDTETGLYTFDASTVNITAGSVYFVETHHASVVNVSGGYVGNPSPCGCTTIDLYESSTLNLYEGATIIGGSSGYLELFDSSTLNVAGGSAVIFVVGHNSSTIDIRSGLIMDLGLGDHSVANVYGGHVDIWGVWEDMVLGDTVTVNIYGHGFTYDPQGQWRYLEDPSEGVWISKLTGIGPDGTEITWLGLPDPATHSNINIVPEPSTVFLLLIGGIGVVRRKRPAEE